jgi:6-phosphofructokinase 1
MGVKASLKGETGKVVVFKRVSDVPYSIRIESVPAKEIANKEKFFPKQWINEYSNDVKDEAIKYFLPLVQGDVNLMMENGIPKHFKIQESILR